MDKPETLAMLGTQDTRQRQTRDTGNIGHTRHKTQDKDKPETLATLGTQHTRQRQTKHKNTITQKTKKMSDTDTTQNIKIKINRMTSFKFRFICIFDRYSNEY